MRVNTEHMPLQMVMHRLLHLSKYQGMRLMQRFDLKPNQAGILFTLHCSGRLTQKELAERVGITPPSMTVALRKLTERGYVTREPDANDQRMMRIRLTSQGEACVEDIKAVMNQMEELMFLGMTPEERMLLRRLLLQVQDNLLSSKEFKGVDMRTIMHHMHAAVHDEL